MSDTPIQSWNDRSSMTPSLYKLRRQFINKKDALPNIPYIPLENAIPSDTIHMAGYVDSSPEDESPDEELPPPDMVVMTFSKNPALVGDVVTVTYTGGGFLDVFAVTIGGANVPTFTIVDDQNLTIKIPSNARTGIVVLDSTESLTVESTLPLGISVLPKNSAIRFTPTTVAVGANVTVVADQGLSTVTAIKVNGTSVVTILLVSDISLTFTVPVGATTGKVQFTNPAGSVTSSASLTIAALMEEPQEAATEQYTEVPAPAEDASAPEEAPGNEPGCIIFSKNPARVGDVVTVTAEKGLLAVTSITIDDRNVPTFMVLNDTSLNFKVPQGVVTGTVRLLDSAGTVMDEATLKIDNQ